MALSVAPRKYTTTELLALRKSLPFVTCVLDKLNLHPGLECILRIPQEARRDPVHYSCITRILADANSKKRATEPNRTRSQESSQESIVDALGYHEHRQLHWAASQQENLYHTPQIHSAPCGNVVKQSENFQRFYRAVVSPTHVRVTAGGRIVPNTRASAPTSSQSEWNNDTPSFEPLSQEALADLHNTQQLPWQTNSPAGLGFTPPTTFVTYNPWGGHVYHQMAPPLMQYQHHGPGFRPHSIDQSVVAPASKDSPSASTPTGLIKISPPTQFDQSRPFMYNGQMLIPVNAPAPVPFNMLGNPSYPLHPQMAPAGFMPPQFSSGHMPGFAHGQHPAMVAGNASQQTDSMHNGVPMVLAVNPVEVQQRIVELREFLRRTEAALQSNRHPIEQTFLENQRSTLIRDIKALESQRVQASTSIDREEGSGQHVKTNIPVPESTSKKGNLEPTQAAEVKSIVPSVVSSAVAAPKRGDNGQTSDVKDTARTDAPIISKSRLSRAAALAPPFQPRSQTVTAPKDPDTAYFPESAEAVLAMLEGSPAVLAENQVRFLTQAQASATWDGDANSACATFARGSPAPSSPAPSSPVKKLPQSAHMYDDNTTHGAIDHNLAMQAGSRPYLVGSMPYGVNQHTAGIEYQYLYARDLTAEEVRARHLYWGKAPRSVQSGLPKFDGKDFYPPSPIKGNASLPARKDGHTIASAQPYPSLRHAKSIGHSSAPWSALYTGGNAPGSDWVTMGLVPQQTTQQRVPQPHEVASQLADYNAIGAPKSGIRVEADFSRLFIEPDVHSPTLPAKEPKALVHVKNKDEPSLELQDDSASETEREEHLLSNPTILKQQVAVVHEAKENATVDGEGAHCFESEVLSLSATVIDQDQDQNYEQRVEKFKNPDQQTLFLQNMLKNEAPKAGNALSGTVSQATAQGVLPVYRGSAAASLTPAMMNFPVSINHESMGFKHDAENRPFRSEKFPKASTVAPKSPKHMTRLEADKKILEEGWNYKTTGTGPCNSSDW